MTKKLRAVISRGGEALAVVARFLLLNAALFIDLLALGAGYALIVAGVAAYSKPIAMIVAGVLLIAGVIAGRRQNEST